LDLKSIKQGEFRIKDKSGAENKGWRVSSEENGAAMEILS
jgi:hypothetical protein